MRKFIPKQDGHINNMFYLVDEKDLDFVYIYNFFEDELKYIAMQDLEKDYAEIHVVKEEDYEPSILVSKLKTPDGTIIQSFNRHDYVTHVDKVTGEEYMLDGGIDYVRTNINKVKGEYITITESDSHAVKRAHVTWGTRGKNMDQPLKFVTISEMTNEHILAVIDTQTQAHKGILDVMREEYLYRLRSGIKIED